jgi:hypothetical protein
MMALSSIMMFVLIVLIALTVGYAMNRFWIHNAAASHASRNGMPTCGNCGYPAHGITTLTCPECGADLRKVGIVKSSRVPVVGSGCLLPVIFTGVVLSLSVMLAPVVESFFQQHYEIYYDVLLQPHSSEFGFVDLTIDMQERIGPHSTLGHSVYYLNTDTPQGPNARLELNGFKNPPELISLRCTIKPYQVNSNAWTSLSLELDPATGDWRWNSPTGQINKVNGILSEQDMLTMLNSVGANTSDPQVVAEARSLLGLLNGIHNGMSLFNVPQYEIQVANRSRGYGDMSDVQRMLYLLTWLAIWVIGMVLLARRAKIKRLAELSEQNP